MSTHKSALNKYCFYVGGTEKHQQRGLYLLLVEKHKIPVETVIQCLNEYGAKYNSKRKVDTLAYMFFDRFLEVVTAKTGITFKKSYKTKKMETAQDKAFEAWNDKVISGEIHYDDF